jgi:phage-related protein (TIGR01555 family)
MTGPLILDSQGAPMVAAPASSPIRMSDSLGGAILGAGRFQQGAGGFINSMFGRQMALCAYQLSGLMRKAIRIPADDRVREWRDWQAESDQITLLEAEEKRLGLLAKVRHAEILRGIGGGALILALPGNPDEPAPATIGQGQLQAVNVVYRTQLTLVDIDKEITSPNYGLPAFYQFGKNSAKIHPSRVVAFRGDPLAAGTIGINDEDAFWGDCRLDQIFREGQRTDDTKGWFSELVKKAKLLRIGIPDIAELTATTAGQSKLNARIAMIATGESILNATVFGAAGKDGSAGETVTDFQISWAGIPAIMDAFDQSFASVADIPFTRLYGRSPAGMNATGESDDNNWNKMVATGQKLETRPCLEQLDPFLIRSAGVDPDKVTWKFAPLDVPSEQDEATTFKTTMEAVTALQATGAIPDVAFTKGVQNLMSEREYMPGLDQALAEIPEDERFGITAEPSNDNTDPSAIQSEGGDPVSQGAGGAQEVPPRRVAANDGRPMTLDDL